MQSCDYIQSINSTASSIILPKWTCIENSYTITNFSRFTSVESIEISDHSFAFVKTFQIDGLNRLKSIKIGDYSFTQIKYGYKNDLTRSFHILNCELLESIQIGVCSFSDYAGDFELKNLPQLQSIQFGTNNFYYSSFVIRGIELILNI